MSDCIVEQVAHLEAMVHTTVTWNGTEKARVNNAPAHKTVNALARFFTIRFNAGMGKMVMPYTLTDATGIEVKGFRQPSCVLPPPPKKKVRL